MLSSRGFGGRQSSAASAQVGLVHFGTVVSGHTGAAVQVGAAFNNAPVCVGQIVEVDRGNTVVAGDDGHGGGVGVDQL